MNPSREELTKALDKSKNLFSAFLYTTFSEIEKIEQLIADECKISVDDFEIENYLPNLLKFNTLQEAIDIFPIKGKKMCEVKYKNDLDSLIYVLLSWDNPIEEPELKIYQPWIELHKNKMLEFVRYD